MVLSPASKASSNPAARPSPAVVDVLRELVGFATVSADSNLALIDWVEGYLADRGVSSTRVPSSCGAKSNLLATIGPAVAGGVVLSGHTDVVPVAGQAWDTDPFVLTERAGLLFGRGTCDMKGFLATALALVDEMDSLRRPIHLALSYDEEIGCLGAPGLISQLLKQAAAPAAVIVGEPTEMQVVTAHKGIAYLRVRVTGYEAHSSLQHQGASAIMAAARLIEWLADRQRSNQLAAEAAPSLTAGRPEPPYTTLHCGLVQGGTAPNITAGHCEFTMDIRTVAGEDPLAYVAAFEAFAAAEVLPAMRAIHPETAIAVELLANAPPFQAPPECTAVALAQRLTGQNETRAQPYAAEAGQFRGAGLATVMCGPGSIEQAHQPNEFIALAQLAAGEQMLRRLINELSTDRPAG